MPKLIDTKFGNTKDIFGHTDWIITRSDHKRIWKLKTHTLSRKKWDLGTYGRTHDPGLLYVGADTL